MNCARKLTDEACSDPVGDRTSIGVPKPTQVDLLLAKMWKGNSRAIDGMLSARMAEIAVGTYFRNINSEVEDVARWQLDDPAREDWKRFDLRVGKSFIDVKNARCPPRRNHDDGRWKHRNDAEGLYVSHCVPRFKQQRCLGDRLNISKEVKIAGVLSPYLGKNTLVDAHKYQLLFLGLTSESRVKRLKEVAEAGPIELSLGELDDPNRFLLPPWVFNYPDSEYKERDRVLELVRSQGAVGNGDKLLLAAAGTYRSANLSVKRLSPDGLLEAVAERTAKYGLSLPIVYFTVLEHLVELLSCLKGKFVEEEYMEALFPTTEVALFPDTHKTLHLHKKRPFFVYDPLTTVETLIHTFHKIWQFGAFDGRQFRAYHLGGLNILRGKCAASDSHWTTILAYCGGQLRYGNKLGPCGRNPLVLGECKVCPHGRLICPDCGSCCRECKDRSGPSSP